LNFIFILMLAEAKPRRSDIKSHFQLAPPLLSARSISFRLPSSVSFWDYVLSRSADLMPRNLRDTLKKPSALIKHVAEAATRK